MATTALQQKRQEGESYVRGILGLSASDTRVHPFLHKVRKKMALRFLAFFAYKEGRIPASLLWWTLVPRRIRPKYAQRALMQEEALQSHQLNRVLKQTDVDRAKMFDEIVKLDQYEAYQRIEDGFVILDAGANMGMFSFLAHFLAPHGTVYAFEPTQSIFNHLKGRVYANGLEQRIIPIRKALGEKKGKGVLMVERHSMGVRNLLSTSKFAKGREGNYPVHQQIEIETIDNFVHQEGLARVDLIKIDTEGYEKEIISGAAETIKRFLPIITCSAYHLRNDKKEIPELVSSISPLYKMKLSKKGEEVFTFWVDKG